MWKHINKNLWVESESTYMTYDWSLIQSLKGWQNMQVNCGTSVMPYSLRAWWCPCKEICGVYIATAMHVAFKLCVMTITGWKQKSHEGQSNSIDTKLPYFNQDMYVSLRHFFQETNKELAKRLMQFIQRYDWQS